jgi:hypothetical protein
MNAQKTEDKFYELCTDLAKVAYEYVDYNEQEVDAIYVFSSMEKDIVFYIMFFKINGQLVKTNQINQAFKESEHDASREKVSESYAAGRAVLEEIKKMFSGAKKDVPTTIKIIYYPKTGKFSNDISYDLKWSNTKDLLWDHIYRQWFEEIKNQQTSA